MNAPAAPRWPAWARRVALGVAALAAAAGRAAEEAARVAEAVAAGLAESCWQALSASREAGSSAAAARWRKFMDRSGPQAAG